MTTTTIQEENQHFTHAVDRNPNVSGSLETGIVGQEAMYAHKGKYVGRTEVVPDNPAAAIYEQLGACDGYC
ncbi:hypothetical protein [uncultured Paraglaciecola sp.]|uniref:hypothetical protein n=1 Tax=uncultured Paraglaciecola sp. TaxID=1765024 RepID=UPI002627802E|nr:hypothetical protein [uncultured Paraglaciecola sp.]